MDASNVVPFGPEAQVLEAVALTLSTALLETRRPSRGAVEDGRTRFETAGNLLDILIRHQERLHAPVGRPVGVSPRAQEALLAVVGIIGNRALVDMQTKRGRLELEDLVRLREEVRECGRALDLVLPTFPPVSSEAVG